MATFKRLDLKVGLSCNNNCLFCAQAFRRNIPDKSTTKIVDELRKNSKACSEVVFTGGEVTIRKDFFDLISSAKSFGYKIILIQSNGRRFSDIQFCLDTINKGANDFSIAIHGHNADLHNSLTTSQGSFEQTKQGIKNLIELNQMVATNTVVVKQNYKKLPEIANFLSNLFPNQVQFAFVHPMGNAEKNFNLVVPKMSDVLLYLKKAIDILLENNIEPRIEAIPPCLIPKYQEYLNDYFIPDTKIADIDSKIHDWSFIRKNFARKKFSQCIDCKFNLCCEGPWKEYPENFGEKEFKPIPPTPNEIIIQLTKNCNLECDFCFDNINNKKTNKEISKEEVFKIIDDVKGKTNAIRFTGGEPLLRRDLNEILAYSKKNNIYTILNTNGLLFNEENISILNNVDDLLISFHEFSERDKKSSIFKKIRKYNKNILLRSCTILTPRNIKNLESFYSFIQFQPVDDWFLLRQVPNKKNNRPISKEQAKEMIDKTTVLNKEYRIKPMITNALPFCMNEKEKTASICIGGKNDSGHTRIYIDSNGNILPDYFSGKVLGNIKKDNINQLWLGNYMKSIRNLVYLPNKCKKCGYNINCKAGLSTIDYTDYLF